MLPVAVEAGVEFLHTNSVQTFLLPIHQLEIWNYFLECGTSALVFPFLLRWRLHECKRTINLHNEFQQCLQRMELYFSVGFVAPNLVGTKKKRSLIFSAGKEVNTR